MKTYKRVEKWTNDSTGEERTFVTISKTGSDPEFVKVYPAFTAKVIMDLMGGRMGDCGPLGILMWFIKRLFACRVNSDPVVFLANGLADIADELRLSTRQIARYIKVLEQGNYIEQVRPRTYAYRVNPNFIYKGELRTYFTKYVQPNIPNIDSKERLGDARTDHKVESDVA